MHKHGGVKKVAKRFTKISAWMAALCLAATPHATAFSTVSSFSRHHALPASWSVVHMVSTPRLPVAAARPLKMRMQADSVSPVGGSATLTLARDEPRELGSTLLERLEEMEGIWYSDDFYGNHGREWVEVSATLVGSGTSALVAIKVSGDANVPSGYQTWRTRGLPDVGGSAVPAEVQVRADAKDPNGFSWLPASLMLVREDRIDLAAMWSFGTTRGTFYKHKIGEGA